MGPGYSIDKIKLQWGVPSSATGIRKLLRQLIGELIIVENRGAKLC